MNNELLSPARREASAESLQRRNWDGLAAVIAAFVGLLALCVSGYTAWLQHQQVRAQVWPYLETGISGSKRELILFNKGAGPAIVRSIQIFVDGKPQRDWKAVFAALGLHFEHSPPYSTVRGVVISPGDHIDQVLFQSADDFNAYVRQVARVDTRLCYCSTLNECWVRDGRVKDLNDTLTETNSCPAQGNDEFIDNEAAEAAVPTKEKE
jgi:hypothetical protein